MLPSYMQEMLPVRRVQFREACSQLFAQENRHQVESTALGGRAVFPSAGVEVLNPPEREEHQRHVRPTHEGRGGCRWAGAPPWPCAGEARAGTAKGSLSPRAGAALTKTLWAAERVESRERDRRRGREMATPQERWARKAVTGDQVPDPLRCRSP